jgi:hypothetical protein
MTFREVTVFRHTTYDLTDAGQILAFHLFKQELIKFGSLDWSECHQDLDGRRVAVLGSVDIAEDGTAGPRPCSPHVSSVPASTLAPSIPPVPADVRGQRVFELVTRRRNRSVAVRDRVDVELVDQSPTEFWWYQQGRAEAFADVLTALRNVGLATTPAPAPVAAPAGAVA